MRFAKRCECEYPLILDEDYCSVCTGLVGGMAELPPPPEDECSPEKLAAQMFRAGASFTEIREATGLDDYAAVRVGDPERYAGIRKAKNESSKALYKKAKAEALQDARIQRINVLRGGAMGRIGDLDPDAYDEVVAIVEDLRREGWSWRKITAGSGYSQRRDRARTATGGAQ